MSNIGTKHFQHCTDTYFIKLLTFRYVSSEKWIPN